MDKTTKRRTRKPKRGGKVRGSGRTRGAPRGSRDSKAIAKKLIPPRARPDAQNDETTTIVAQVQQQPKARAPRRKVTLESHLADYTELMTLLDSEIDRRAQEKEKGIRVFRTVRKMVKQLEKDTPKIANLKRTSTSNGRKVSGFTLLCEITDELADFMGVKRGTTPSRAEITNAICVYARLKPGEKRPQMLKWEVLNAGGKRNLQDPNNNMAIIPDETLTKLLKYEQYKEDVKAKKIYANVTNKETKKKERVLVSEAVLYYRVIQILIQPHIIRSIRKKVDEESVAASSSTS